MEKSEFMRETLGDHIFNKVLANKKIEWDRFRTHVTDYELNQYLPVL
jgi:glutamine synthetase